MNIVELKTENNTGAPATDYGFVGVKYLSNKYKCSTEEILNLFIDCEYSIQQTVRILEQASHSDWAA